MSPSIIKMRSQRVVVILVHSFCAGAFAIQCYSGSVSRTETLQSKLGNTFGFSESDLGRKTTCPNVPLLNLVDSCFKVSVEQDNLKMEHRGCFTSKLDYLKSLTGGYNVVNLKEGCNTLELAVNGSRGSFNFCICNDKDFCNGAVSKYPAAFSIMCVLFALIVIHVNIS